MRVIAHVDPNRVEHATFKTVPGCSSDCPYPDVFFCAPHIPGRTCDLEGGLKGRDYLLFQEMAKRGGFNVEWALTRDVSKTVPESYTAMAVNFTTDDRFDLSTNWWTDTSDRRKLGLVIGHHHTDASRVLITARNSKKKSLDLDLLVRPFTGLVWAVWCAIIVTYSIMMFTIERNWIDNDDLGKNRAERLVKGLSLELYLTFERFSGGSQTQKPMSRAGRGITSAFGLFCLLFMSLYTAKLAAIIVVQDSAGEGLIKNMNDVRDNGGAVIMFKWDPLKKRMETAHPYLKVNEDYSMGNMTRLALGKLLADNQALAEILPANVARNVVLQKQNCDVTVTSSVFTAGGGFMTSVEKCRSNVHVILDGLLMEIESDGTLDDRIETKTVDMCSGGGLDADAAGLETKALDIDQMMGLFMFVGGSMCAIFFTNQLFGGASKALNNPNYLDILGGAAQRKPSKENSAHGGEEDGKAAHHRMFASSKV